MLLGVGPSPGGDRMYLQTSRGGQNAALCRIKQGSGWVRIHAPVFVFERRSVDFQFAGQALNESQVTAERAGDQQVAVGPRVAAFGVDDRFPEAQGVSTQFERRLRQRLRKRGCGVKCEFCRICSCHGWKYPKTR